MIINNSITEIFFNFLASTPSIVLWVLMIFLGGAIFFGIWNVFGSFITGPINK